jgi:ribosomal protein S18 acetylase RimI-like enzyme
MTLAIRPMRADELEACAALYDRVVRATFTWLDVGDPAQDFRNATLEEEVLVAEVGGRLAGLASFYRPEHFLHSIYLDAEFQGRGIGQALMRVVEEGSPQPVTLKVQVLNLNARRFYARERFKVLEEGGAPLPSNDRWLRLGRHAPLSAPSPAPRLEIRPAASDAELDLCAALYERQAARNFTWEPDWARTAASKRTSFEGEEVLVATEHGVLAGFVAIRPLAHVHSLFVEPQGAGTGLALLRAAQARCERPVTLKCAAENERGHAFYRRHGFTETGRETEDYGGVLIRMRAPENWV